MQRVKKCAKISINNSRQKLEDGKMLSLAIRNTAKLVREKSKEENVRLGRLFTKKASAKLMAEMVELDTKKSSYTVLDPGAGTGILSAAVIERICRECPECKQIFVTAYEPRPEFYDMLTDNLERIRKKCRHDYDVRLYPTVYRENYLTESKNHYTVTFFDTVPDRYDIVICNPPTDLTDKTSAEALAVGGITQVRTSLAYLFLKLAKEHVDEAGQLVFVLPTTFATASALTPLRRELKETLKIRRIHLFIGKGKNASRAVPLKSSFYVALKKTEENPSVLITTSLAEPKAGAVTTLPELDYDFVVDSADGSLTLPKSIEDTKIVGYISTFPETLTSLGLKMSTGLVLDSRCEELLFTDSVPGTVPLIRPIAIKGGTVRFPLPIRKQYIAPKTTNIIQKNKNMIMVKRVPSGSDERFVNCGIYLAAQLPAYRYISTHNKINYIDMKNPGEEMSARLVFGLFALFNSTIYDRYISIVSKSKQINSKEMRNLRLPPRNLIENIGMRLMETRQTSVAVCDQIVNPTLHIITK